MPTSEEYETLMDLGLCPRCGGERDTIDTISCTKCLNRDKQTYLKRRTKLLAIQDGTFMEEIKTSKSAASWLFLDPEKFRIGILDIEATGLTGGYHIIMCVVIKKFGTSIRKIFRINVRKLDVLKEEKKLLERVKRYIENELDGVITYYGSQYDVPMLRTRMFFHGIQPIPKLKHLDMYYTIRRILNLEHRRMANVNELLKRRMSTGEGVPDKTRIGMSEWTEAIYARSTKALDYIVDHCIKDVDILENIVNKFEQFAPDRVLRK